MEPVGSVLADLPSCSIAALLVLCRVSAAIMLLPGLGESEPPPMLRIGLALGITTLIAPALLHAGRLPGATTPEIALAVVREVLCGLFLGMAAKIVALSLPIASELITLATGLTSIVQPDPDLGAQSSALARLFSLAAPVLFFSTGLFRFPLAALADSYAIVPLDGGLPAGDASAVIVHAVSASFSCAIRLAAPFLVAGTLWQVCLALLGRFVPSLQAGSALAPGQLLGGMALLALLVGPLLGSWAGAVQMMFSDVLGVFHG